MALLAVALFGRGAAELAPDAAGPSAATEAAQDGRAGQGAAETQDAQAGGQEAASDGDAQDGAVPDEDGAAPEEEGDDAEATLTGLAASALARRESYEVAGEVEDAAAELVLSYQDAGDVVLAYAGWLDLTGNVWGCVASGPGWVDICLVSEADAGSKVELARMEAAQWEDAYESG